MATSAAVARAATRFSWTKHGLGRIVAAQCGAGNTVLTTVSHKAPARCIPLPSLAVQQNGAAVCVLSNYGGGLLGGDVLDYDITVKEKATLGLITQGSNRIYKQQRQEGIAKTSQSNLCARIHPGGCLVLAPDPVSVFKDSCYKQHQEILLEDVDAHICLIDWFSAGRLARGERWQQERLESSTQIYLQGKPVLMDSTVLDPCSMDWSNGVSFNAYATILLYGSQMQAVVENCKRVQEELAEKHTRIRQRNGDHSCSILDSIHLSGQVVAGVSRCDVPGSNHNDLYVARFAAQSNEDLYRIFHGCLKPLSLGLEFYKDRIHSTQSSTTLAQVPPIIPRDTKPVSINKPMTQSTTNSKAYWSGLMLADSALPVGSFAHSAGLESAHQLGIVGNESSASSVEPFVRAVTRSTRQLSAPLVHCGHAWVSQGGDRTSLQVLQECAQALLVSNEPACRASLDQGQSLLRVARQWMKDDDDKKLKVLEAFDSRHYHLAVVWGAVTALLDLTVQEACQLLTFCVARDIVSAAVRLNLVGPLASVQLLAAVQDSIGTDHSLWLGDDDDDDDDGVVSMDEFAAFLEETASSSAPVVDAIQPTHDILATRLFRT